MLRYINNKMIVNFTMLHRHKKIDISALENCPVLFKSLADYLPMFVISSD